MTTYIIQAPKFRALVSEAENTVVSATEILDWAIGDHWTRVRDYCQKKGWQVIPCLDENDSPARPTAVQIGTKQYSLKWFGDILVRVTLHDGFQSKDLSFDEIPESLKNLL
jgi:hypothetical protein